jgi:hypothetical protein
MVSLFIHKSEVVFKIYLWSLSQIKHHILFSNFYSSRGLLFILPHYLKHAKMYNTFPQDGSFPQVIIRDKSQSDPGNLLHTCKVTFMTCRHFPKLQFRNII